jgi:hypothetical protein
MSHTSEKEPNGLHKRKREDVNEGEQVENLEGLKEGEMDDLLLEDLINGADGLPPQSEDADFGVVMGGEVSGDDDASRIDLMAREILEDSSQSQGTGYGLGRKKPRRQFVAEPAMKDGGSDEESLSEEEEVELLEEEDDKSSQDETTAEKRARRTQGDDEEEEDEDDEDDGEGHELNTSLGSKGLYAVAGGGRVGGKGKSTGVKDEEDDDDEDDDDDADEEREEDEEGRAVQQQIEAGGAEAEDDEDEEDDDDDEDDEGEEHALNRARMDRYLDVDAKMGLLARDARRFGAQGQVSTLLTSALLQLANGRADFAAEVAREIALAKVNFQPRD